MENVKSNKGNEDAMIRISKAYPHSNNDQDMLGRSIHTDDSMSRIYRKDGSAIKHH